MNFPQSTEFNKRIPKQKFYENLQVSPAIKRIFVEDIKSVYWKNKIAPETTNLAKGSNVDEIEVFEIKLASNDLNMSVLKQIDAAIPYHIIFLLEFEGKFKVVTAYKEKSNAKTKTAFKIGEYFSTQWLDEIDVPLKIDGLNMDSVYENFVRQIAGDTLENENDESLKVSVERAEKRKQLEKQIAALENKIRKEKQFNKQVELNTQLKKLKKELEEI